MNADSAIEALVHMKSRLMELRTMTGAATARLSNTKEELVGTFDRLSELLSRLLEEKKKADVAMKSANGDIAGIEKQGAALRNMRNRANQDSTNWCEISWRLRETSWSLGQMLKEVDSAQQDAWDAMNALRDSRFSMATSLDDGIGIEDLFAEEHENFEKMRIEMERRSERLIIDTLRLNIRSELETQTDKMFDELEEWRKQHVAFRESPQRERHRVADTRRIDRQRL